MVISKESIVLAISVLKLVVDDLRRDSTDDHNLTITKCETAIAELRAMIKDGDHPDVNPHFASDTD